MRNIYKSNILVIILLEWKLLIAIKTIGIRLYGYVLNHPNASCLGRVKPPASFRRRANNLST